MSPRVGSPLLRSCSPGAVIPNLHRDTTTTTVDLLEHLRARAGKGRTVEVALLLILVAVLAGMAVAVYLLAERDEDRWDE